MNRPKQSGVVLVITLLMLSVVTFMAVVFLAVSRREKASVVASADFTDAKLMADAALARAQAEVTARILAATNVGAYDFLVSTNYGPAGFFRPQAQATLNVTNVGYWLQGQNPDLVKPIANKFNRIQTIANLMYDSRAPVFIRTNYSLAANNPNAWDFRFYLDLNRNGLFEDTGFGPSSGRGETRQSTNFVMGDPQWVGILEYPNRPHSETNRFIGRYAFATLPAGKSLDINFIHNYAKRLNPVNMTQEGFSRDQGVGSWEINLAAFLREVNTNIWPLASYQYNPNRNTRSLGRAFEDANQILRSRYGGTYTTLPSLAAYFGAAPAAGFTLDYINTYSDSPLAPGTADPDIGKLNLPWSGGDSTNVFFDAQEFFNPLAFPANVVRDLVRVSTNLNSSYDRYTYYRMLAQMGVDSRPALSNRIFQADLELHYTNKFNLNYQPASPEVATLGLLSNPALPWDPSLDPSNASRFFHIVADRLLRASLTTNVLADSAGRARMAFALGEMPVRQNISITNIQIFPPTTTRRFSQWETNVEYTATLHRVLQVAANIYDATTSRRLGTTNEYPTVFRPLFRRGPDGEILIGGFAEVTNSLPVRNAWIDMAIPSERLKISANTLSGVNVFGVPWVIGTKVARDARGIAHGLPNFNEFSLETAVQVSRKLEVRRLAGRTFLTNQMYVIGISNIFGVEAWNSYTQAFTRPLDIVVTNRYSYSLSNVVNNTARLVLVRRGGIGRAMTSTDWPGMASPDSYLLPVHTNFLFVTNSAYLSRRPPYLFNPLLTNNFEASLDPPRLFLSMTNRLQYWVIDRAKNRILDFVNLDGLNSFIDISQAIVGDRTSGGGGFFRNSTQINEGDLWLTDRTANRANAPSLGLLNQIAVASGDPRVSPDIWASHPVSVSPQQKQLEIDAFVKFLAGASTNLVMQVPFTPTRKVYQRLSWQANDPLVHYTVADLSDAVLTNPNSTNNYAVIRPAFMPLPQSNLQELNERYQPWGGNPKKQATGLAYSMAVKDPLVRSSDDWSFPTNKFPNIGWLGRVHRGTPWQTIYLKSEMISLDEWTRWNGNSPDVLPQFRPHAGSHPTNDWKFLDLFTVAPNANAARGLLAVNQTNAAAWSAVLSGVHVLSNNLPNLGALAGGPRYATRTVEPASPQLQRIVAGVNRVRNQRPGQVFENLGDVLAVPELTVNSPFLNLTPQQIQRGLTDEAVERIPQQVMSLLKSDEPRVVVYAFGQSLKPAERSIVTSGNFYNICTNYQITGEVVAKAVLRIDDAPKRPRVVVESFNILPSD